MSKQQEMHYKETTPMNTVLKLKKILADMDIELEEDWLPVSSIGTYSLRVTIKGTAMGTNGKGVSKEYAMASAYAEFFERYQNNFYDMCCIQADDSMGFCHFADERRMTPLELAAQDNSYLRRFFEQNGVSGGSYEKAALFAKLDQNEKYLSGRTTYETRPYYNATQNRVEYIPYYLSMLHYGSNGMCAGNSPEEAIVQGLSEILERWVQKKMMQQQLSFPDVPQEVLAQYPYVHNIYQKLQQIPGYCFALKDCSMGGRYPVAALIVSEKNSGRFGIKFGAHPDFGIAMERTLTEASQGVDIQKYAHGNAVDFSNTGVTDPINIYNSFKYGTACYPYQVLSQTPDFAFAPVRDAACMTSREILDYMVDMVQREGFELLVRDVSYLGFPSYHVVVPGMSEIFDLTQEHLRAANTHSYLLKYINNPALIDEKICRYLVGCLEYWSRSAIDNKMRSIYGYGYNVCPPGEEIGMGWLYFSAMGYAFLGDFQAASIRVAKLIQHAKRCLFADQALKEVIPLDFYFSVYYYCTARAELSTHSAAMEYLRVLYDEATARRIDELFGKQDQILVRQYPRHNPANRAHCLQAHCCDYHQMLDYSGKLKQKQLENPISQGDLAALFSCTTSGSSGINGQKEAAALHC